MNLPRQPLSKPALLTTGVLHIALLWVLLQSTPLMKKAQEVVHYLKPISVP